MQNQPQLPGHVSTDQFSQMIVSPESFAVPSESLTEQLAIEQQKDRLQEADPLLYMIHVLKERLNTKKVTEQRL